MTNSPEAATPNPGSSLHASARLNRILGIGFVAFLLYLLIMVAGTTDLMIFLPGSEVPLPLLGVGIPLVTFYVAAPFVALLAHVYVLLRRKEHQDLLRSLGLPKPAAAAPVSAPQNAFIRVLSRVNMAAFLWRVLHLASLFWLPVLVLISLLARFNDYHAYGYASLQFAVVVLDLVLCVALHERVVPSRSPWRWMHWGQWVHAGLLVLAWWHWSMALVLHKKLEDPGYVSYWHDDEDLPRIDLTNQAHLVAPVSDALVTHYLRDSADVTLARHRARLAAPMKLNLRERDLRYANLDGVNLVGAEMIRCNLAQASMVGADVSHAQMYSCDLRGSWLPNLIGEQVMMEKAQLEGAMLAHARLEGADLTSARLDSASFNSAHLEGANLEFSHMNGTELHYAHFEGSRLASVDLSSSGLYETHFEGADLHSANLAGVILRKTHLESAELGFAHLEAATLDQVHLEGADLQSASMQGAKLEKCDLSATELTMANLLGVEAKWTRFDGADLGMASMGGAVFSECTFQGTDMMSAHLYGAEFDGQSLRSLQAGGNLGGADWGSPSREAIFEDSSANAFKRLGGERWDAYIRRVRPVLPVPEPPKVTGLGGEQFKQQQAEVACWGGHVGYAMLRRLTFYDAERATPLMCERCPDTLAAVLGRLPGRLRELLGGMCE